MAHLNLAAAIIYLFFAAYIGFGRESSRTNRLFIVVVLLFANWAFWDFLTQSSLRSDDSLPSLFNLGAVGWIPFAPALFWFAVAFAGLDRLCRPWIVGLTLIPAGFLLFVQWQGGLVTGYVETSYGTNGVWSSSSWSALFYAHHVIFALGTATVLILTGVRAVHPTQRRHGRILAWLIGSMFAFGFATEIIIPTWFLPRWPNMGQLALLPVVPLGIYAIERLDLLGHLPSGMTRSIFRDMSDGGLLLDSRGLVRRANPAFLKMVGLPWAKVRDRPISELITSESWTERDGLESLRGGGEAGRIERSGGDERLVLVSRVSLGEVLATFQGSICLVKDMSPHIGHLLTLREAVRALDETNSKQQEIRTAKETLAEQTLTASREKTRFLAAMSHEIRTPLNGITLAAQLLQYTLEEERQRELLSSVFSSVDVLRKIIDDVIDLAQVERGELVTRTRPFNPVAVARDALRLFTPQITDSSVSLQLVETRAPQKVMGDPDRVGQILVNLIGNALKFTGEGRITVTVSTVEREDLQYVEFAVADTGIGISPDALDRVFERYAQEHRGETSTMGGAGLGLHISRAWVERMGGEMGASLGVCGGTTVSFLLPVKGIQGVVHAEK